MLDLIPAEVADVDKSLYAVLELCEYTEAGDITYHSRVLAAYRILLLDLIPRVRSELLDTEGHLTSLAVQSKNLSLNLITYLNEFLCAVKPWRPAHLGNVDESFYAWLNLDECAVVLNEDDFTLNDVANLQVRIQAVPRMWSKLLVS